MCPENALETVVKEALEDFRIDALIEWDALAFVYTHGVSLASPDHLSRLLGYSGRRLAVALEKLARHRLIEHSARSDAVPMYWFAADMASSRRLAAILTPENNKRTTRIIVARELQKRTEFAKARARNGLHFA